MCSNHEDDLDEEHVLEKQKLKAEVYWGLSESSTNLAKELLPSEYITLSPSKEQSLFTADDSAHCTTSLSKSIIDSNGTDATDTDELLKTAESSNVNVITCIITCCRTGEVYKHEKFTILMKFSSS